MIIESSWKNKVFRKSWDKFYNTIKKAWPPTSNLPHNYHPRLQATRPVTHYQNNIMYASTKSTHAAHDNDNLLIQKSGVSDSKRVKIALTAGLIAGSTALAYHQSSSGVSNRPSSVANIGDGLDRQYHTSTVATAKQTFPTPSQFEEDVLEFAERLVKDDTPGK